MRVSISSAQPALFSASSICFHGSRSWINTPTANSRCKWCCPLSLQHQQTSAPNFISPRLLICFCYHYLARMIWVLFFLFNVNIWDTAALRSTCCHYPELGRPWQSCADPASNLRLLKTEPWNPIQADALLRASQPFIPLWPPPNCCRKAPSEAPSFPPEWQSP